MVKKCRGICDRYDRANYKIEKMTGFCRDCSYGFYLKDVQRFRCPCCSNILRTHSRNRLVEENVKRM
jgi:hypothetical protein